MKYIIIGLGSFGSSLAVKLTALGNEVIGIDASMKKVDSLKDKISHTICLDASDQFTVVGLPLHDTDAVIVAIGEDQGTNIMVTAIFKNLNVKRLISRAIDPLHEQVLQAIGVHEIVHPEEETAERWAKKLCYKKVVDSFELNEDYTIVEASVPESYEGRTIQDLNLREKYKLLILTVIRNESVPTMIAKAAIKPRVKGVPTPDFIMRPGDIIVLFGHNKDIKKFLETH
jgi:trk system potassium uptake protein